MLASITTTEHTLNSKPPSCLQIDGLCTRASVEHCQISVDVVGEVVCRIIKSLIYICNIILLNVVCLCVIVLVSQECVFVFILETSDIST